MCTCPLRSIWTCAPGSRAAYLLVRDRDGALAGYSAAAVLDADCAPRGAPAEVVLPGSARRHPGLRAYRARLGRDDLTVAAGCRVSTPARTAWDLARRLPVVEAVVAVDALARRGGLDPAELLARRTGRPGARGCRRVDEAVALADPRAESPMETRLRVALMRSGLAAPEVQYRIVDEYGFTLARVDLAYPAVKVAIEYDGSVHFDRRRAERDRQRDAELAGLGWQTVRLVADDLAGLPQTVRRVRLLLESRRR
jgi:very-short-patch-repair endonuclease